MMRSLFAGVSGLQTNQVKMDVISNNIANINTVGFKAGTVTFAESLTQTLREGTRPRTETGGINPSQVGLGAAIASIGVDFSQGNLETTGVTTDLAIQGNAFFVVTDGENEYYTRAGNFEVDGEGRLVCPDTGYIVQGMMANSQGVIDSSSPVSGIELPFGQKSPARATSEIDYYCNLDADTQALAQVWSADYAMSAEVTASAAPVSLTIDGTNDQLSITVDDDQGGTVTRTLTLTHATYSSVSALVAEINNQLSGYEETNGEVTASVATVGGVDAIKLATVDRGGTSTELTLGGNACANLNLGTAQATGTTTATLLNDLDIVGNDISAGDIFRLSGVNPDGTVVSANYVYAAGDTVQDLLDALNTAFSGTTATMSSEGNILLTDSIAGESNTVATITFLDDDSDGSSLTIPSFNSTQTGRDAGTHTASITVYDSKGGEHTVALNFTNISTEAVPNVWSWEAMVDEGEIIPTTGNTGSIRFNNDGSVAVFTVDSGQPLTFDPGSGADAMSITLGSGDSGTFSGITQLSSATTTVAKYQDGYGMGNLQTVSIDEQGEISGNFSNGISQTLGQIVLATFNNPSGLNRSGDNLYTQSANSGTPVKGRIGAGIQGTISSGALEMSNVDLAKEFTDMIVAQRGFQANSRVITTADTLLQEIVQLKR